jgi:sugar phosphate isomerase/epimerase
MKFGIASRLLWSYPLCDVIAIAERLHYDGVEIWAEHYIRDRGRKSRLAFSKSSLIFALHAFSFDVNITSMNKRIRRESIRQMFDSLHYASEIGARCVVVHPGRTSSAKDSPDEYRAMQVDSLSEIVLKAKELGVDVNMEIMEPRKKEIVTTPEMTNEILQAIPMENFGITLDLSHAQLTGSPLEFIRRLEKISHIHLSDAREGTSHCLLGEGDLDVCGILKELRRRYDGLVIIEGWNRQDELGMVKKTTERVNEIRSELQTG